MNTQLLITFTRPKKLQDTIDDILKCYTLAFNKVYVLQNVNDENELICSYNVNAEIVINKSLIPKNTISVHRNKKTNTIFTINALNYVIALHNDGEISNTYPVPWDNYKNMILVTNTEGLKKIPTKISNINEI